jgi:phosphopentomutase
MLLDRLAEAGVPVLSIGKISDVFLGRGVSEAWKTKTNGEGMEKTLEAARRFERGLVWVNLVDFDMLYGHRNDAAGYAAALEAVDRWLPALGALLRESDLLLLTADHGCDPTTPSTDHSREYVPVVAAGPRVRRGVNLGTRQSLADMGQTIAANFGVSVPAGASFLEELAAT